MQARKKRSGALVLALLVWLLGSIAAWAQQPGTDARPTLTVSGNAQASADPDRATVRFGVTAQAADAAGAQDQVNTLMQRVLEAVTRFGVPERAVRTEELWLTPLYDDPRFRPGRPAEEPAEPRIVGYRAGNVVSVELDDLGQIGGIIDAGIQAGANQLQGVSFQLRDDAAARAEAMRKAVAAARAQADAIADAMGMRIVALAEVVAGGYDVRPPIPFRGARMEAADMAATPVQPGQVDVSANVTITYYLAD